MADNVAYLSDYYVSLRNQLDTRMSCCKVIQLRKINFQSIHHTITRKNFILFYVKTNTAAPKIRLLLVKKTVFGFKVFQVTVCELYGTLCKNTVQSFPQQKIIRGLKTQKKKRIFIRFRLQQSGGFLADCLNAARLG